MTLHSSIQGKRITVRALAHSLRPALTHACILAAMALSSSWSQAATVVLSTSQSQIQAGVDNQGWLNSLAPNENPLNDNHVTGFFGADNEFRSFFSFSLEALTGPVVSARLELRRYQQQGTVNLGIWDTSATAAELAATRNSVFSPEIFEDLGSGISYGSFEVLEGDDADVLVFQLNAQAVSALNASAGSGYFSLGAAVAGDGSLFAASNDEPGASGGLFNSPQRLVLQLADTTQPVPEPSSLALAMLGLAAACRVKRLRRVDAN